jgi:hypothetical protein
MSGEPLDPADRILRAMAKTFWPFYWAGLNDETQAQLIKYTRAVVEEIGPELAEVERLRAELARRDQQITAIRMAPVALALLADAWRHLKLDTPEDQELHQRLLDQTDATIRAAIAALNASETADG